jgi:hypothetical protein
VVPRSVHAEVLAGGSRPGAQELLAANWLQIVEAPAAAIAGFTVLVDRGEAEATSGLAGKISNKILVLQSHGSAVPPVTSPPTEPQSH